MLHLNSDGTLRWCGAARFAPQSVGIGIAVFSAGFTNLTFSHRQWRFSENSPPTMSVRVDATLLRGQVKGSHTPDFLTFKPADGPKALSELADGRKITLRVDGTIYEANLSDARVGVTYVRNCIQRYGAADLIASFGPGSSQRTAIDVPGKKESQATGFFVSTSGHVLTNNHVIAGCTTIRTIAPSGEKAVAQVVAQDSANDLALLKSKFIGTKVAAFGTRARLGETIYAFGYPLAGLLSTSGNFTVGNVSALAGDRNDIRLLQISAPIQSGNSGGPLLDGSGRVIGIVVAKLDALLAAKVLKDIPQNVNFAIKSDLALTFMNAHGIDAVMSEQTSVLEPTTIAERAKAIAVMVQCNG